MASTCYRSFAPQDQFRTGHSFRASTIETPCGKANGSMFATAIGAGFLICQLTAGSKPTSAARIRMCSLDLKVSSINGTRRCCRVLEIEHDTDETDGTARAVPTRRDSKPQGL